MQVMEIPCERIKIMLVADSGVSNATQQQFCVQLYAVKLFMLTCANFNSPKRTLKQAYVVALQSFRKGKSGGKTLAQHLIEA
jgi:hypothetical protein